MANGKAHSSFRIFHNISYQPLKNVAATTAILVESHRYVYSSNWSPYA